MDCELYELMEDNFDFRLITPNTWMIGTKCTATPWGCDCYLLEGGEQAILIDSGMSKRNLKHYIDELDLCQYFGQKKLKDYATFFSSSSSFC